MREVLDRAHAGDEAAELAIDVYIHRLSTAIGTMAAALGGVDALAFTGGVGERSAEVRDRATRSLGFLGVALDDHGGAEGPPDREITAPDASVRSLVIRAREDLEIARQARAVIEQR
jgi:acetate kinase